MSGFLRRNRTTSPPSDPAAVNSICTLHAPKYIPKIIAADGHAFLTFGVQKGHFAGLRHYWLWANFGNGAKLRETNIRNGFSIVESLGIHCFRAFPWKKFFHCTMGQQPPP